jgi:beta-glucosidase
MDKTMRNVSAYGVLGLAVVGAVWTAGAQSLPYLDPSLPAEQRAADLVHRMTVEEKVTQLTNQSRAVPRLQVPSYDWWSEALHGVAVKGTTVFPEPMGLASTFDTPAIHEMAIAIGVEGRIKHDQAVARAAAGFSRVSISGRRTSTSSAIRAGAAARRRMGKTHFSPPAWAWRS